MSATPPRALAHLTNTTTVLKAFGRSAAQFVLSSLNTIIVRVDMKQQYLDRYENLPTGYRETIQDPRFVVGSQKRGIALQLEEPVALWREVVRAFALLGNYAQLVARP